MHHENAENRELVERFVGQHDSANTRRAYGIDLAQLLAFLGPKPLQQVAAFDLAAFSSCLDFRHYAPTTVERKLDVLRSFIRWARAEGMVSIGEAELCAATRADGTQRNARRRERHRPPRKRPLSDRARAFPEYINGPDWRAW